MGEPALEPCPLGLISWFSPKKGTQNLAPCSSVGSLLGHWLHFHIKALEEETTPLNKPPLHTRITPKTPLQPDSNSGCRMRRCPGAQPPPPHHSQLCLAQNFSGPELRRPQTTRTLIIFYRRSTMDVTCEVFYVDVPPRAQELPNLCSLSQHV